MKNLIHEKQISCLNHLINYVDEGEGDSIIFLHNGGGFWQSWMKQILEFRKTNRVLAIDWPRFGESSESDHPITLDLLYSVLSEFIAQLKLERPHLIGNCIGASAALKYAVENPDNTGRLILFNICPGNRIIEKPFLRKWVFKLMKYSFFRLLLSGMMWFLILTRISFISFPRILFGRDFKKDDFIVKKYLRKNTENKQSRSRIALFFSVDSFTLNDWYRRGSVKPDLLIWGELNRVVSLKPEGEYHARLLGINDMKVIKNGGHLCMYEYPDEVNRLLSGRINSHS